MIKSISPGEPARDHKAVTKGVARENDAVPAPVDTSDIPSLIEKEGVRPGISARASAKPSRRRRAALKAQFTGKAPGTEKIKHTSRAPKCITLIEEQHTGIGGPAIVADDIERFEKKLGRDLGSLAKVQNDWDIEKLDGWIPTVAELQDHFKRIAANDTIPWEYLPDGCYARAHEAANEFVSNGLNCAKLYVMVDDQASSDPFNPFPDYRFRAENKFTRGEWWYHVGVLVFAQDEETGKVDGYVIDRSVNADRPMKADEWIKSLWSADFPMKYDLTFADVYDPPMESHYPSEEQFSQKTFHKYLAEAKKTNIDYLKSLEKIKKDYYAHHPSEKPPGPR
ncbi:MAG: protein-glutamine glutaminase family protein [Candidatus Eremiobacteraeota bacterium]|nr:protein-glutamine glutaminase family protein [Candidatus Eremiobacteraeota bacterium]